MSQAVSDMRLQALEDVQEILGCRLYDSLGAQTVKCFGFHGPAAPGLAGVLAVALHLFHEGLPGSANRRIRARTGISSHVGPPNGSRPDPRFPAPMPFLPFFEGIMIFPVRHAFSAVLD
jgi:hypothetical protein